MSKYHSRKAVVDGITFDSKKEAARYVELKCLEKNGEIINLVLQPRFVLQPSFKHKGKTLRAITYVADFSYQKGAEVIVEDTKGYETDVFKLKEKIFLRKYGDKYTYVKG